MAELVEDLDAMPIGPEIPSGNEEKVLQTNELPYELINNIPCYQEGHTIDGRIEIFERIGFNDLVGATYLGTAADGKEMVLRVAPADQASNHVVRMESIFLCRPEMEKYWRYFSQINQIWSTEDAYLVSIYYRGGPRLDQCFEYRQKKFTFGTAGRFAEDMLDILQALHSMGYIARNINFDRFHFDAASRHLFMADISDITKDLDKLETKKPVFGLASEVRNGSYTGSLDFAPFNQGKGDPHSCRQDLESWLYAFIYMVKGSLPWDSLRFQDVALEKMTSISSGSLFEDLPEEFLSLNEIINEKDATEPVTDEEYAKLKELSVKIYRDIGEVTDHDQNFDFERDPTAEEIPRLVLCRDDE